MRDTWISCLSYTPYWGPGLQPRHVLWLGIEPITFQFAGWHSVHWATAARARRWFCMWTVRAWGEVDSTQKTGVNPPPTSRLPLRQRLTLHFLWEMDLPGVLGCHGNSGTCQLLWTTYVSPGPTLPKMDSKWFCSELGDIVCRWVNSWHVWALEMRWDAALHQSLGGLSLSNVFSPCFHLSYHLYPILIEYLMIRILIQHVLIVNWQINSDFLQITVSLMIQ